MNEQLKIIYEADQEDRENWNSNISKEGILNRDRERRGLVQQMLDNDLLIDGIDYWRAAMVFQHGEIAEDYLVANKLARKATELGEEKGKWLTAASWDRFLTHTKEPYQKYGTQYRKNGPDSDWYVYPIDPKTTDEERAEYNVPPIEEILRKVDEMNMK